MRSALQIGLRAGDKIFVNGAVLSVDRKVRIELLNDATFLLGSHVMQIEDATTPLRQLYFLVQGLLMDPAVAERLRPAIDEAVAAIGGPGSHDSTARDMTKLLRLLDERAFFDALKIVRGLVVLHEGPIRKNSELARGRKEVA